MPRVIITSVTEIGSERAAGAGQSQPTENCRDQSQHQGRGGSDYSVAGAGTTCGDSQIHSTVDRGDQAR